MNFSRTSAQYILLTLLGLFALFFAFPNSSQAACQVNINNFNFRNGGDKGEDWFDEENKPVVYLDFQTSNCQSGDSLHLTIFGIPPGTYLESISNIVAASIFPINTGNLIAQGGEGSIGFYPGENTCFGANDTSSVGNGRECLVFAMLTDLSPTNPDATILALAGNLIGPIPFGQAEVFSNNWGGGVGPTPDCLPNNQYLFRTQTSCPTTYAGFYSGMFPGTGLNQKLINFYASVGFPFTLATQETPDASVLGFPGLTYHCDGLACENGVVWQIVEGGGLLPYGETSPYDNTPVVTPSPLPEVYQENYVPLAPLPFEGLNGGSTPDLGSYLAAIFRTGIVIAIILAVLMIVFHGIAYATTGAIQKKDDHREGVWNAIMGLLIALGAWLLLNTINPELASNLSIGIPEVTLDGDADSISTSPITDGQGTITAFTLPSNLGLYCPGGGGSSQVASIIDSFENKVTYRWGGKGGALPSGGQYKLSPNESSNGAYMCTNDSGNSVPCRTFCPGESVCLDCSGFVNHVRQCAGLSIYSGTSSMTSSPDAIAVNMSTLSNNGQSLSVNNQTYNLQPGDLLVWNGHVVIYYGNGKIAESQGSLSGIQNKNSNIKKHNLKNYNKRNNITHLIKVNP